MEDKIRMIDRERLAETFKFLVEIDSVSKQEKAICVELTKMFKSLGGDIFIDDAGEKMGGNSGNLIIKIKGDIDAPSILFSAHMDTVEPGRGIKPVLKNGVFTSDGTTILGADDKSAIAVLLEALRIIREKNIQHGPVELVITVCEEIGLLGAKHLDFDLFKARYGYALDTSDTESIVTSAPAANTIKLSIYGKDAHAGAEPEKGINAISIAGKAIASIESGRIDHETTCNIGLIKGGKATNIVPDFVTVNCEARSHNKKKLDNVTNGIISAFKNAVDEYKTSPDQELPRLRTLKEKDFPLTSIPDNHYIIRLARRASENLGRNIKSIQIGGASDANIFFQRGIVTGVLGTGMRKVHTLRESISIDDMVKTTELVIEIIKMHSANTVAGRDI